MICECTNAVTRIVDVVRLQWQGGVFDVTPRPYAALAFRIRGTATITVDGKPHVVNTNDILYLPQGVAYHAEYSDTELVVIHFETAANDEQPEVYSVANTEEIYKAFLSAHILWQEKMPGHEAYVRARLYCILGQLCETDAAAQMPAFFLSAISYINEHYVDSGLVVETICKHAGISATNLRTLFQKHYHKTPIEYITQLRLERARNLIACGVPIEQAAEQSGFNDSKYFARVVKKHLRCTPRELKSYGR